jgi:hypothetical protein
MVSRRPLIVAIIALASTAYTAVGQCIPASVQLIIPEEWRDKVGDVSASAQVTCRGSRSLIVITSDDKWPSPSVVVPGATRYWAWAKGPPAEGAVYRLGPFDGSTALGEIDADVVEIIVTLEDNPDPPLPSYELIVLRGDLPNQPAPSWTPSHTSTPTPAPTSQVPTLVTATRQTPSSTPCLLTRPRCLQPVPVARRAALRLSGSATRRPSSPADRRLQCTPRPVGRTPAITRTRTIRDCLAGRAPN